MHKKVPIAQSSKFVENMINKSRDRYVIWKILLPLTRVGVGIENTEDFRKGIYEFRRSDYEFLKIKSRIVHNNTKDIFTRICQSMWGINIKVVSPC